LVPNGDDVDADVALLHGDADMCLATQAQLARQQGPLVKLISMTAGDTPIALASLLSEQSLSINTAAAGGNASLMTIEI
ncbi:hypothetical protein, partial [Limnohabitans sp.]|uniref:hypothetical protein n=1 Tax=Limnohabitans sp. TaxID=1907725 RepID=UPI00286F1B42